MLVEKIVLEIKRNTDKALICHTSVLHLNLVWRLETTDQVEEEEDDMTQWKETKHKHWKTSVNPFIFSCAVVFLKHTKKVKKYFILMLFIRIHQKGVGIDNPWTSNSSHCQRVNTNQYKDP